MVFLFHSWYMYVMLGLFEIWRFSVQRIYSGFKVIEAGIFFTETSSYFSEILWSSCRPCSQIWRLYVEGFVHQLWHVTGFQLLGVNRDGCHIWGKKCSLFPEHLISLPLGGSWFYLFIIYTLQNLSKDYVYGLMTGLFAWISLDCFVVDFNMLW